MRRLSPENQKKVRRALMLAVKISVGSSAAIFISQHLGLEYATSAGTITLLTLMNTKWDTVRLSMYRLFTFGLATVVAGSLFTRLRSEWAAFGIFVFIMVAVSELLGWRASISVNAVIGSHFLTMREFALEMVWNELQLVLIGIVLAVLLNLFQGNRKQEREISKGMRDSEARLKSALRKLAAYLRGESAEGESDVWDDLTALRESIQALIPEACEYQENTFHDMGYYQDYLQMRLEQCHILQNLHSELQKIRSMPVQALVIADYMDYMGRYVLEMNHPQRQIQRLQELFADMEREALPVSREEFESRAILYHILMDLEDFLRCKEEFVDSLTEKQLRTHWGQLAR